MNLQDLVNEIYKIKKGMIEEKKERAKGEIYVTEIVNFYYPAQSPLTPDVFVRGHLYHRSIESLLQEKFNAQTEVSIKLPFNNYTISGRIDAVVDDVIVEIKSSEKNLEPAKLQASIYRYMLNKLTGKDYKTMFIDGALNVKVIDPYDYNHVEKLIKKALECTITSFLSK